VSDERTPFWKKELSVSRNKKAAEPTNVPRNALDEELEAIKQAAMAAVTPTPAVEAVARPVQPLPPEPTTILEEEWSEPKVPFWKKELGGGKKTKVEKPKREKVEKPKRVKVEKIEQAKSSTPFWKKELTLGRKSQPAKVNELDPETPLVDEPTVSEPKVPFWKKELGGKKKTSEPKARPDREHVSSGENERPFWRKQIAIGKRTATPKMEPAPKPQADDKPSRKLKFQVPQFTARPRRIKRDKSGRALPQSHKKLVGLKIGASQIAAARVANNGSAEVLQLAREDLQQGIVVGGELREPELLAEMLRDFFKRNNLPRRGVRLGIANNRIGVRTFEIVGIDDAKQLDNAIRYRAQEALPIPIEEAVLDYQILGESKDEEDQTVKRVLLVVAYRELVDRYVSACNKAGIELVGIDLEAFALLRVMAAPQPDGEQSEAALVVVSIGHERSTFAVSDGRVCEFTRVLEWGGSALNVAIARAIDKAPSEAEPFKRAIDLNATKAPEEMSQQEFDAVRDAVRRQVQSFARELVSSLQFYQNQPGSLGIGEIVLTGGTAHLPGIADELKRLIGVNVRVGDPLERVRVGKKVADDEQIGSLAVAIGLGIED
jgi:type IV pilus assembly protein PilM